MGGACIFHQPETEEEMALTDEAMRGCPCEAIFSDGDPFDWSIPRAAVLPAWLRREGSKLTCQHGPPPKTPKEAWWRFW